MKRVLLMICSIILVAACVFGLFACVAGVKDIMNIKDYKTADSEVAKDGIAQARDGIAQLKENEQVYLDGVGQYSDGLAAYAAGKAQLADGYSQYYAGKQQLADGQKQIDDNTQAYLEGKALISKLEGFMPLIEGVAGALQNIRDFNAGIPLIGQTMDSLLGNLRAQVLNLIANSAAVSAISNLIGMDIGSILASNPTDTSICGNVVAMYYDGLAQLKQYEDGLVALEEGKKQLADAEVQLADGERQLAAGAAQLADGDKQLSVFEEGELTLADGAVQLMSGMGPAYRWFSTAQQTDSLAEMMAKELGIAIPSDLILSDKEGEEALNQSAMDALMADVIKGLYQVDADGNPVEKRGFQMLDLDKCSLLLDKAEEYMDIAEADVTGEVVSRIIVYALAAFACIIGIIAAINGLIGTKKFGRGAGLVSAILAVAALVIGIFTKFGDYCYATRVDAAGKFVTDMNAMDHYVYSGALQQKAVIILAIVAVLFVIVASMARKAAKESEKYVAAQTNDAAVAGAAAAAAVAAVDEADDGKLAQLEAENAELKAMVASLAADIATIKEN